MLVWLLYMGVFAKRGWIDYRRMIRRNSQLQSKQIASNVQITNGKRQLRALRTDPKEQERMVRKVLGYVRPNETVIEFD